MDIHGRGISAVFLDDDIRRAPRLELVVIVAVVCRILCHFRVCSRFCNGGKELSELRALLIENHFVIGIEQCRFVTKVGIGLLNGNGATVHKSRKDFVIGIVELLRKLTRGRLCNRADDNDVLDIVAHTLLTVHGVWTRL